MDRENPARNSIFSRIIRGEAAAIKLYEDDLCIAIEDRAPQAPVHFLVIPKEPLVNLCQLDERYKSLLGHLMWVASQVAQQQGIGDSFRVVSNNGRGAGQTVFHLHLHVMGRKSMHESGTGRGI